MNPTVNRKNNHKMKTKEQMQAALAALQDVCLTHGIALIGVCKSEGIYGEIELVDATELSEADYAHLSGDLECDDQNTFCVDGIKPSVQP